MVRFGKKILCFLLVIACIFGLVSCLEVAEKPAEKAQKEAEKNVQSVYNKIVWDNSAMQAITKDLSLVTANKNYPNVSITWDTDQPDVISSTGVVNRPNYDDPRAYEVKEQNGDDVKTYKVVKVVLTATITSTYEGEIAEKDDEGYTHYTKQTCTTEPVQKQFTFTVMTIPQGTYNGTIAKVKEAAWNYIYNESKVEKKLVSANTVTFNAMTKGVVVSKLMSATSGFFIDDGTAGIYVYADNTKFNIGDSVQVLGEIYVYYGSMQFGSNITVTAIEDEISTSQAVPTTPQQLEDRNAANPDGTFPDNVIGGFGGQHIILEGYLNENSVKASATGSHGVYCLVDASTGEEAWIYYNSYNSELENELKANLGKYVKMDVYTYDRDSRLNKMEVLFNGGIEETEAPKVDDKTKLEVALKGLSVPETASAGFALPTAGDSCVWSVTRGTAITVDGNFAKVNALEVDDTVVLKVAVTVGSETGFKQFTVVVPAAASDLYVPKAISQAAAGTYKFALYQANLGKYLFATGEVNASEYLATSDNAAKAADFTVAATEGGYTIQVNGKYVVIYENSNKKVRIKLDDVAQVYAWDAELKLFTATLSGCQNSSNDGTYYLGTYNTYDTMSASKTSYISGEKMSTIGVSQFPAYMSNLAPADYKFEAIKGAAAGTYKFSLYQANLGKQLFATGEVNASEYLATTDEASKAADFVVAATEGGYTIQVNGKYVVIYENSNKKVRIKLDDAAQVYVWDAELKLFTTTLSGCQNSNNDGTYYLGTYNTFDTISASKTSYISGEKISTIGVSQFPAYMGNTALAELTYKGIEAAVAGEYYFALYQATLGKQLFATGEVNGSEYLATTTSLSKAAKFTVAATEGGYTIQVNGKYVVIYENSNKKVRIKLDDVAQVYAWDAELKLFTATLSGCQNSSNDGTYYLGTYNTYDTMSASKTSYISGEKMSTIGVSQFPAYMGGMVFVSEEQQEPVHECHHVCPVCGGCQDAECTDPACANKCTCAPYELVHAGTAADPYSVEDAAKGFKDLAAGTYTESVYVKGTVKSFVDKTTYFQNIYLTDGTNEFLVYSCNPGETFKSFGIGDEVTIKGFITNFSGTIEMSNKKVDEVNYYPTLENVVQATCTISVAKDSSEQATVTLDSTSGKNGEQFTFTVSPKQGYKVKEVLVNGKTVEAKDGIYTATINGNTVVKVATQSESIQTTTKTVQFGTAYNGKSVSSYTDTWSVSCDGLTLEVVNFNNNKNGWTFIKCGREKYASIASIGGKINGASSVDILFDSTTKSVDKINSAKVIISDNEDFSNSTELTLSVPEGGGKVTVDFGKTATYFKVVFDVNVAGKNGIIVVTSLTFTYVEE